VKGGAADRKQTECASCFVRPINDWIREVSLGFALPSDGTNVVACDLETMTAQDAEQ
jgi:hypothetical protein